MIVVLGAGGMLGTAISKELEALDWESTCYTHRGLDITDELALARLFKEKNPPSIIINCAAATGVDWCEEQKEQAYRINAESVRKISILCLRYGAKLFHISTDYVFDGRFKDPYTEEHLPRPVQVYGESKLLGERYALDAGSYVFRIQWVYGPGRKNFTDWVIESVISGKKIPISIEQIGIPSSTAWLAKQILLLTCSLSKSGIYHVAHDDWCTRYEFAEHIARALGKDPEQCFDKMDGANFGIAKRPLYTILDNKKVLRAAKLATLGSWKQDLLNHVSSVWELPFVSS